MQLGGEVKRVSERAESSRDRGRRCEETAVLRRATGDEEAARVGSTSSVGPGGGAEVDKEWRRGERAAAPHPSLERLAELTKNDFTRGIRFQTRKLLRHAHATQAAFAALAILPGAPMGRTFHQRVHRAGAGPPLPPPLRQRQGARAGRHAVVSPSQVGDLVLHRRRHLLQPVRQLHLLGVRVVLQRGDHLVVVLVDVRVELVKRHHRVELV